MMSKAVLVLPPARPAALLELLLLLLLRLLVVVIGLLVLLLALPLLLLVLLLVPMLPFFPCALCCVAARAPAPLRGRTRGSREWGQAPPASAGHGRSWMGLRVSPRVGVPVVLVLGRLGPSRRGHLRVGGPAAVCRSAWGTVHKAGGPAAVHPRAGGPAAP